MFLEVEYWGILLSTFAEDKNRNHESTSSNRLALSYFLRSKAFWSVFLRCVERWHLVKEYSTRLLDFEGF